MESVDASSAVGGAVVAAPGGPKTRKFDISNLYELWTLDVLPESGRSAARIFETSPGQFKKLPANIATVLARLQYQTGHNENYLKASQRRAVVEQLLGASDGTEHSDESSKFHQAAEGLRKASVDCLQRAYDTGERQLRNAFRDAAKTMYSYLTVVEGSVATSAMARLDTHFRDVVAVLQSVEYCGGLGLPPAPAGDWPRFGVADGDGAEIIAELTGRAAADDSSAASPVGVTRFLYLQRVADYGADSLDSILNDPAMNDDANTDAVIDTVYRWWQALRDFRATRDVP